MLYDHVISFCDTQYQNHRGGGPCIDCNHPSGACSGGCSHCLYQIHYPSANNAVICKNVYDCTNMMFYYVCQYTYIYTSEILYALNEHSGFLARFENFNMMSIACGACPDLMALEEYTRRNCSRQPISYRGFDVNEKWRPIHACIKEYCDAHEIKRSFFERDVFDNLGKYYSSSCNIIVISYLISYLYNTGQVNLVEGLFDEIVFNIEESNEERILIIINDVNSNRRGRDCFSLLLRSLRRVGITYRNRFRFFDSRRLNFFQRNGTPYISNACLIPMDEGIINRYHMSRFSECGSYQLVVEID